MNSKINLLCRASLSVLAMAMTLSFADSVGAQVLPSGALIDIDNGSASNSASNTAGSFQTYSVAFTADTSGNNYILFAFREDPAFWTFEDPSLTVSGNSTNLLTNSGLTQGGAVSPTSGVQAPADWGIVYQNGAVPYAAGTWDAPATPGGNGS
jgi:hypothetical protein